MHVYVLAITPSPKACTTIQHYQGSYPQYVVYHIPPHITLYPPFHIQDSSEEAIISSLRENFSNYPYFTVDLTHVGYFEGANNVVYLGPSDESALLLKTLHAHILNILAPIVTHAFSDYTMSGKEFSPHLTIAERIPSEEFETIKKEFSGPAEPITFPATSIDLYRRSPETKQYDKILEIPFIKRPTDAM